MSADQAMTAAQALRLMRAGEMDSETLLRQCLAAIDQHEPNIKALAGLRADEALADARRLDRETAPGLLQGIPFAVKDVIDTVDLPTEFNSPLYVGHQPAKDAHCVAALKAEGAIVLAKASTVEFASRGRVPDTTNPYDLGRTPGGTSSGSAAAVAAGIVPLALGTQTGGSTIRPASFCGVAAMKPTFGTVPIDGVKPYAPSLDTVGWMARCVEDLALVARALRIALDDSTLTAVPRIGLYRTPYWAAADQDSRAALDAAARCLDATGVAVEDVAGPTDADRLNEAQDVIMHGEGRVAYLAEYLQWPDRLHPALLEDVQNAEGYSGARMRWAYDYLAAMRPVFDDALLQFDAWLTPAVPGEAPVGLDETGDATFNRLWTGLHTPAITLPGFRGNNGLPVGIQLVAARFKDSTLLDVAAFVEAAITGR